MVEHKLSKRVMAIAPSTTLAINAKTKELIARGKQVINLSVGEPDFQTPKHIQQAAINAICDGHHKYTAVDGTPQLKAAIIGKFQRDNGLHYDNDQVMASTGGKQAIFNLFMALLNPGDEVIIPAPYWVSYPDMAIMSGATPVIVRTNSRQHYKITPQQLDKAITDRTKLVILNSPNNPTGMVYKREELQALAAVLLAYPNVYIMSDDIYEHILWQDEPFCNIVNSCPKLYPRTIIINGVSKAYAMTGWRIGIAAGPKAIIASMKKIQSQSTSNPCAISQAAAATALSGNQACLQTFKEIFKKRHDFVYEQLCQIPQLTISRADGAFYMFPYVLPICQRLGLQDEVELANYLLDQAKVAVVPGSAFGIPGAIRLSYALAMSSLEIALNNIKTVLAP